MYECFIQINVENDYLYDQDFYNDCDWDTLDAEYGKDIFLKKTQDLEQARFLIESFTKKLSKYGKVKTKIVEIIQDWGE